MLLVHSAKKEPIKYKSFPSFREWAKSTLIDDQWKLANMELKEEFYFDILQRIRLVIKKAIVGYNDKLKMPKAQENTLIFESLLKAFSFEQNSDTSLVNETQLIAYSYVMDFAFGGKNVSKSWLCKLHFLLYNDPIINDSLRADYPFPIGKYKHKPNKINWGNRIGIFGVPVKKTSSEMLRYFRQLRSKSFLKAHPVLQASYAHYAFTAIHPFFDGNGRVARLIAFCFLYRSNFVPSLSLNRDRSEYASALREADLGNFRPFIGLVQERSIESIALIKNQILSALQQTQ